MDMVAPLRAARSRSPQASRWPRRGCAISLEPVCRKSCSASSLTMLRFAKAVGPLLFDSCPILCGLARSLTQYARRAQFDDFVLRISGRVQNLMRVLADPRRLAVEASALTPVAELHRKRGDSDQRSAAQSGYGCRQQAAMGKQMRIDRQFIGPSDPRIGHPRRFALLQDFIERQFRDPPFQLGQHPLARLATIGVACKPRIVAPILESESFAEALPVSIRRATDEDLAAVGSGE